MVFEKQTKKIEKHDEKQVEVTKSLEFSDKKLPSMKNVDLRKDTES